MLARGSSANVEEMSGETKEDANVIETITSWSTKGDVISVCYELFVMPSMQQTLYDYIIEHESIYSPLSSIFLRRESNH